ncbi:MAG: hypothetical protein DBX47_02000 [Clostridiales bacterium]|nr:MAG: hypothetical protein DBX47_02000 [Clostridiales bacterium]
MPSSMIHLLTGKEIDANASTLFYIGCLAPDCIEERGFKDHHHFRDRKDRLEALHELKEKLDLADPYQYAILLHLYADLKWDEETCTRFRKHFYKDDVFEFQKYRKEIGVVGNYFYHIYPWNPKLWKDMEDFPVEKYPEIYDFPADKIHEFIVRQGKWHTENNTGPSKIFTADFIKYFVGNTTFEFRKWIKE